MVVQQRRLSRPAVAAFRGFPAPGRKAAGLGRFEPILTAFSL